MKFLTHRGSVLFIIITLFIVNNSTNASVVNLYTLEPSFYTNFIIEQPVLSYKIIDAPEHTYGYEIFNNKKLIIKQVNIPGIPGNRGFKTNEGAKKIAELVIQKIKSGNTLPTIQKEELINLKVL